MKDIRTSLIEAIGTELFNYRQVGDLADSLECQKVAEIAADVVLERLEQKAWWDEKHQGIAKAEWKHATEDDEPLYRWRGPNRDDGNLSLPR